MNVSTRPIHEGRRLRPERAFVVPAARTLRRHRFHALALAAGSALITAVAGPVSAQTPADTFRLADIVVTATRTPQPRAAIPAHVTVLPGETLRARGIANVAEALRDAGAGSLVQLGAPGAAASLFLRGGESDYVQVLIDGVQVNDPGGAFDWAHLGTADIERIEIVRGPVSVLYGSDAVVGVVQIFTRPGSGAPRLAAALGVAGGERIGPGASGTSTSWDGSVSLGAAQSLAGRPLAWSLHASRRTSSGLYAFNNAYDNANASARASYSLAAGTSLALNARYGDQRFHYPTDGSGALVDHNRFTDGVARTLSAALGQQLGRALRAELTLASHRSETGGSDPADDPESGWSRSSARVRRNAAELRVDAQLPHAFELSVGAELERQHGRTAYASDGPFGPYADSSRDRRAARAAYGQLVGRVGRVALTGGARLDHSDQFGDFATARAGVTLEVGRTLALHAAYGTGFKEPTFFETYATGFARGNPALAPEQSRSGELGVRAGAGGLALSATVFDQRFRNLIQYTAAPPRPDAPNYFNVGESRARGLEVETSLTGRSAQASVRYTWLDTEVLDDGFGTDRTFTAGAALLRRPAHQAVIGLDWRARARLTAGARVRLVGERDDLDFTDPAEWQGRRVVLPGYATTDLTLGWSVPLARGDARLRLGVTNLWDARYAEVYNFPRPGRTFTAGLEYGLPL